MGCLALEFSGCWVELGLSIEMEISGRAFAIWYYVQLGGLWWTKVLNPALAPQKHSDTHMAQKHQDPVSHMARYVGGFLAFSEVWGLLPAFSRCSLGVVPHVDVFLMYLWGGRWSPHLTALLSWTSPPIFLNLCFHKVESYIFQYIFLQILFLCNNLHIK